MQPFSFGNIVKGAHFFDRKEETNRIVSTLQGGNNIVLFAPRRFGKTSLVFKAVEKLERLGFKSIYIDFMSVYSRESFIENYLKAILKKQSNLQKSIKLITTLITSVRPILTFDHNGTPEFSIDFLDSKIQDKTIEEVIDLPEKLSNSKNRFIIIMDEFQDILKLNGESFEKLLRSKIQHHHNTNYIFLGSKTHLLNDMFNNKGHAFYNSAMIMQIGALPEKETIAFIQSRFSIYDISIDIENTKLLIKEAGNIPYYIQMLSAEIWQNVIKEKKIIEKEDILESAARIVFIKRDYYYELFDKLSIYQKKLLKALTISGKNVYSKEYNKRFRLSANSTTQKAITNLLNSGIIEKDSDSYYISDPFFKRYIENYA